MLVVVLFPFVPVTPIVKSFSAGCPTLAQAAAAAGVDTSALTIGNFFGANLLPVTIGNIIGGGICVGVLYWCIYLKGKKEK